MKCRRKILPDFDITYWDNTGLPESGKSQESQEKIFQSGKVRINGYKSGKVRKKYS